MINNFSKPNHYQSLITVLLVITGATAIILLINELLILGLDRKYIICAAIAVLAISFLVLAFQSYKLYQQIRQFLPKLFGSNLLSETITYMITDEHGKVWLTNDNSTIDFCNQHVLNSWSTIFTRSFPVELPHQEKNIQVHKLKDICSPGDHFNDSLLITIAPTNKPAIHSLIQSLEIPAIVTNHEGALLESNDLYRQLQQPNNLTKTKIYEDEQERYFIFTPGDALVKTDEILPFTKNHPISTLVIDNKTNLLSNNNAFKKLLSLDNKTLLKPFAEYLDEPSQAVLLDYINNNERAETASFEIRLAENPTICMLYITYIPQNGHYFCNIINITEYKNIEMNFIHSQKMQAIGQLAGGIAHDFNNLLTAMLGFCDLLLIRHPAGDPSFADIMQIQQNANRAANLVRQLLAISRKQVLRPQVLDVTNILAELANLIRRLIGENITLKMNYGRDLMQVMADQGQLEQVIMNLAVNARDAIGASKGTLTINTSNVMVTGPESLDKNLISPITNEAIAPGKYVLIEVIDTGSGISKEIIDKIFEPFFSTKEIGAGTGLGLSTVYGIIKQTGGYLYVASKEGKGTKFCIYIKSALEKEIIANKAVILALDNDAKLFQPDLTGNSTILLVEDEVPVRMFSTHALTNKGYRILEAESGEEALAIMEKHGDEIALIISDVIMPGMNGPTLIEEIKKTRPNIKVIFMSGYAEEAFSKTYGIDGDFYFLAKPFTLKQLASKVKDVLIEG